MVKNDITSKDGFCDKSDAEILNSLKIGFQVVTRGFKREALKKIDSAFALLRVAVNTWQRLIYR